MNVSTVFAIQTQGRGDSSEFWVTTYRVQYSQDCTTFINVLDVDGNNQVQRILTVFKLISSVSSI